MSEEGETEQDLSELHTERDRRQLAHDSNAGSQASYEKKLGRLELKYDF